MIDLGKWVSEEYSIKGEPTNLSQLRETLLKAPAEKNRGG